MTVRYTAMRLGALAHALLAVACSGVIDVAAGPDESPRWPGPDTVTDGSSPSDDDRPTLPEARAEALHRLNRLEYNNTVRDLLGTELRPADAFPADSSVV